MILCLYCNMTLWHFRIWEIRIRIEGITIYIEPTQVCANIARSSLWKKRIYCGCNLWPLMALTFDGFSLSDSVSLTRHISGKNDTAKRKKEKKEKPPWLVWQSGLSMACKPKGHQFNSQLGHMPGLQARSPVGGVCERQPHIGVSRPLFLPPLLSLKNK